MNRNHEPENSTTELEQRITINTEQYGDQPCIRDTHVRASDVLNLLANGLSVDEILEEMPHLERGDIYASLWYASRRLDNPMVTARGMWKDRTDLPDFAEMRREMDRFAKDE